MKFCGLSFCLLKRSNAQGAAPALFLPALVNGAISENLKPERWLWYPSSLSSRWTIPLPTLPPHPHADITVFISNLRGHNLIFSYRTPKPLPFLTSYLPLTPWSFFSPCPFTFSIPSHLSTPHFSFVPTLKNLISVLFPAAFTFSCSCQIHPSHSRCSLTLPLLWAPPLLSPLSLLPAPSSSFCNASMPASWHGGGCLCAYVGVCLLRVPCMLLASSMRD